MTLRGAVHMYICTYVTHNVHMYIVCCMHSVYIHMYLRMYVHNKTLFATMYGAAMEEELQKFRVQWKEAIHNRQACLQGDAEVDKQEVVGGDSPHGEPNDIHDTSDTVPNSKRFQTENTASEATAKLFSIDISVKNSTQPPGSNQRLQKYFKDEEDDKESPEGGDERGVSFHPRPGHREEVPPLAKQRKESFVDKLIEDLVNCVCVCVCVCVFVCVSV